LVDSIKEEKASSQKRLVSINPALLTFCSIFATCAIGLTLLGTNIIPVSAALVEKDICIVASLKDDPTVFTQRGNCDTEASPGNETEAPGNEVEAPDENEEVEAPDEEVEAPVENGEIEAPVVVAPVALVWHRDDSYPTNPISDGLTAQSSSGQYKLKNLSGKVHVSSDSGATWVATPAIYGSSSTAWKVDMSADGRVMAAVNVLENYGAVWVSTDYGKSWIKQAGYLTNHKKSAISVSGDGSTIYVSEYSGDGLIVSRDSGSTWEIASPNLGQSHSIIETVYDGGSTLVVKKLSSSFAGTAALFNTNNDKIWTESRPEGYSGSPTSAGLSSDGQSAYIKTSTGEVWVGNPAS
jgi:hypothetical protein